MPKYRTPNGSVVERPADYVAVFPPGCYIPVPDDTPLRELCCGMTEFEDDPGEPGEREADDA